MARLRHLIRVILANQEPTMIALDTETTGIDFNHGALPFYVTVSDEDYNVTSWCWEVDPSSRKPVVLREELEELRKTILKADRLVLHNAKFDARAIYHLFKTVTSKEFNWPWDKTIDTTRAAHICASKYPKNLTDLSSMWLNRNIAPYEVRLGTAVKRARAMVKSANSVPGADGWMLAANNLPSMPSARGGGGDKDTLWKFDMWLPRAIANRVGLKQPDPTCEHDWVEDKYHNGACKHCGGYRWWVILSEYSDVDPQVTMALWKVLEAEINRRGLSKVFYTVLKTHAIAYYMEQHGVTTIGNNLELISNQYQTESSELERQCKSIAREELAQHASLKELTKKVGLDPETPKYVVADKYQDLGDERTAKAVRSAKNLTNINIGYQLELPKAGTNKSLQEFFKGALTKRGLVSAMTPEFAAQAGYSYGSNASDKVIVYTESGQLSLNKSSLVAMKQLLEHGDPLETLINHLLDKRSRDTAVTYMNGYQRFWRPIAGAPGYYRLYPSVNPTGSDTLRWTSQNPNEQNISKKEGFNLRYAFGPAPGREWWSCDAKNIELRLPAYEAKESDMIALFEDPDSPPYYGSNHLLNFHTVYPDIWDAEKKLVGIDKVGPHCKKKYASTYYQWCKNGGFAIQYNAGRETADRAFHRAGCFDLLKSRFNKLEAHNQWCINFAKRHGYIETIPDKTVDPNHGYPLECTRTDWGGFLPTVPLSYRTQGSAMYWMGKAMIRCTDLLNDWNRKVIGSILSKGYFITMQVHDELVFDFPKAADPRIDPAKSNLGRVRELMKLMEKSGDDFNIPTPTSCEYHPDNWSVGVSF